MKEAKVGYISHGGKFREVVSEQKPSLRLVRLVSRVRRSSETVAVLNRDKVLSLRLSDES